MPVKLVAPIEKEFVLERSDLLYGVESDPTKVTVRQATQEQNEKRSMIHSEVTQIINQKSSLTDELQFRQRWSIEELKRIECQLTMISCNILDENGKDLFKFRTNNGRQELDMSDNEFKRAWGKLPTDVAQEIHEKVLEVNLSWGGPLES